MDIPNPRYERKFAPPGLSLAAALALVRRHPALFREAYPERVVNNVYFDTPELRHYCDHVSGSTHRLKIRIRWYGEFGGAIAKPTLEIKRRCGAVSGKESQPLPAFSLNGTVPDQVLAAARNDATLPGPIRLCLAGVQPVLGNRYRRRYFCSGDGSIRLTVDWDLEFLQVEGAGRALSTLSRPDPLVIIELKYPPAAAERIAHITGQFPFRLSRCSKYVLGIQHLPCLTA